jgi:RNA recognition motif-containing protein
MDVFVGNLSPDVGPNELQELFEKFGEVLEVRLIKGQFSKKFNRYGFVTMATQEQAEKVIEELNGTELKDMTITVGQAKPTKQRSRKRKKKQKRVKQGDKGKNKRRVYGGEDRPGFGISPHRRIPRM